MVKDMHQYEKAVLLTLKEGKKNIEEICSHSGLGRDSVIRASYWLKEKGIVEIKEIISTEFQLEKEGENFILNKFPEQRVLKKVSKEAIPIEKLSKEEIEIGLPWAKKDNWIVFVGEKGKKYVNITEEGKKALYKPYKEEEVLKKVKEGKVEEEDIPIIERLCKRGNIRKIERKVNFVLLTEKGKEILREIKNEKEVNILTKDMIVSGEWKNVELRKYDIKAPVERLVGGKFHPLRKMIERIKDIFAEMGFEEMEGNNIESSFWNFDALFQPQDHPARELADTFYLSSPSKIPIPNGDIVKKVKNAHELGWKYKWTNKLAEKAVLRTHTTSVSARFLADTGEGKRKAPAKYFCVGRVYRNEATDFKHLAEFYQVEGIVLWENATFCDLLGCLKEFYKKLGFEKIRFKPSYFPYTEPSLEVEVFFERKGEWLELGGAGIFRPEVCIPLWGKYPVLAWGLSLERPLMLKMGLNDIRIFYKNDINWLQKSSLYI